MSVLVTPRKDKIKTPNSDKKLTIQLPIISPNIKSSKNTPRLQMATSVKKKRREYKKKDVIQLINEKEMKQKYNEICNLYRTPYDLCVKCLEYFPTNRNRDIIKKIKAYLTELIGLVDIISRVKNNYQFDKVIEDIAERLKYKYLPKNRFVCRYGDKGTHFSILLKGKIIFLVPKLIKCYLNKTEYIEYLLKLKKYGEHELLKKTLILNQQFFDLGEDFEQYLKDLVNSYKKSIHKSDNHNTFLTDELYYDIVHIVDESNKISKNIDYNEEDNILSIHPDFNDEITPEIYIERIKIPDLNLDPKDRKKVNIYFYQNANYYEGGQIYGTVALENKNNKITATAITADNCHIGTLTKEEYQSKLLAVHIKSRELLYNLISSYDILGFAPKKAFDNRFCHMFKCIRFKRGTKILEVKKKLNSVYIFYSGKFEIYLNNNIVELYELVARLKEIRAKMLGIKEQDIKKEISDIYLKKEVYSNYKYTTPEKMKFYLKKYSLTISLVNDKMCIGLMDTLDPDNHLGLFNCNCISQNCDGYDITYDSLKLVNRDYPCLNNCNKITLTNLEYYLKRVLLHIKEIELKIKKYEENLKYNNKYQNIRFNTENNLNEVEPNKDDESDEDFEIRRNTFQKIKKNIDNEINLVQNIGNSFRNNYQELMKKKLSKIGKKLTYDSYKNIHNNKYESIKTTSNEIEESKSRKSSSYISRIKKSIRQKKYLLHLAQCKSNKFMKIQKEEIRSLLMTKNRRDVNNYIDLTAIFQKNKRNNNSEKSDLILDNIISSINKKVKRERILSSYLTNENNERNNEVNCIKEENKIKEEDSMKEENSIKEESNDVKEESNVKEDKDIQTEEFENNKVLKSNKSNKNKDLFLINSRFNNKYQNKHNEIEKDFVKNTNIINLDGNNSLGINYMIEESPININKKYNKQLNMNKFRKIGKLNYSEDKKYAKDKMIKKGYSNKAIDVIYHSSKGKVHLVDPLLFDKFNVRYFNNK